MGVQIYPNFEVISARVRNFLENAGHLNFFDSVPWFEAMIEKASPEGDEICIYVAEQSGKPAAALIVKKREEAGALRSRMLLSPTHGMYTSVYGPILGGDEGLSGLRDIAAFITREAPPFDMLRFDSLERASSAFDELVDSFKANGMLVQPFFNFDNWQEDVSGLSIDQYLATRSSQTRYFINRHVRRIEKSGRGRFEMVTGGARLSAAMIDYALVDLQSWKSVEPYPYFIPMIIQAAAQAEALRLGLLYIDDEPAAVQIWIVAGERATIFRLHYAAKFAQLAVGTALTFEMFRYVLEHDRVKTIDFGRGDDDYKKKWLKDCHERWGLLVFNPRRIRGCLIAARHLGGHLAMTAARTLRSA